MAQETVKSNKEAIFKKAIDMLEECKSWPSKEDAENVLGKNIAHQVQIFFTEAVIFTSF